MQIIVMLTAGALMFASGAVAAEFNANTAHSSFIDAFNSRNWDSLKDTLADDIAFHRANADQVFVGPDAVIDIFKGTIGAPDQWNVKLVKLDSTDQFAGKDGKVVERGDFAVTAGANDESCYVGSYMMTWMPQGADSWKLQALAWQDVETDIENCK